MVNTTLGTLTLEGDGQAFIAECSARKEAMLSPLPLYGFDSSDTEVFDYGGTIKTINIQGIFVATNKTDAQTFVSTIEGLIQGDQSTNNSYPKSFIDDYRGTIKVKIMDCETTKTAGEPLIVRWSLKLVEASDSA